MERPPAVPDPYARLGLTHPVLPVLLRERGLDAERLPAFLQAEQDSVATLAQEGSRFDLGGLLPALVFTAERNPGATLPPQVLVHGDVDADGICAGVIVHDALRHQAQTTGTEINLELEIPARHHRFMPAVRLEPPPLEPALRVRYELLDDLVQILRGPVTAPEIRELPNLAAPALQAFAVREAFAAWRVGQGGGLELMEALEDDVEPDMVLPESPSDRVTVAFAALAADVQLSAVERPQDFLARQVRSESFTAPDRWAYWYSFEESTPQILDVADHMLQQARPEPSHSQVALPRPGADGWGPRARTADRLQPALSDQQRHQLQALTAALSGPPEMLAQGHYLRRPLGGEPYAAPIFDPDSIYPASLPWALVDLFGLEPEQAAQWQTLPADWLPALHPDTGEPDLQTWPAPAAPATPELLGALPGPTAHAEPPAAVDPAGGVPTVPPLANRRAGLCYRSAAAARLAGAQSADGRPASESPGPAGGTAGTVWWRSGPRDRRPGCTCRATAYRPGPDPGP